MSVTALALEKNYRLRRLGDGERVIQTRILKRRWGFWALEDQKAGPTWALYLPSPGSLRYRFKRLALTAPSATDHSSDEELYVRFGNAVEARVLMEQGPRWCQAKPRQAPRRPKGGL